MTRLPRSDGSGLDVLAQLVAIQTDTLDAARMYAEHFVGESGAEHRATLVEAFRLTADLEQAHPPGLGQAMSSTTRLSQGFSPCGVTESPSRSSSNLTITA